MSDSHLCLVLAANDQDYLNWCERTGRQPLDGSNAWALSGWTGFFWHGQSRPRTFQVTDRWKECRQNRRTLADLRRHGVPYGDEDGPWPAERIPDLHWPSWWERLARRTA